MRILVPGGVQVLLRHAPDHHRHLVGSLLLPGTGPARLTVEAHGLPAAADNGAYSGFNEPLFLRMLERWAGGDLLWVAAPDVVAQAGGTLRLFESWGPRLRSLGFRVALVGQDGMEVGSLPWGGFDAFFVGGSTEWKLGPTACELIQECRSRGVYVHMGRVNSYVRLRYALSVGCDSVDGSGYSRYRKQVLVKHLAALARWERQPLLW